MSSATPAPNVSSASAAPIPGFSTGDQEAEKKEGKKYKIMVVDDEEDARELFVELIQSNSNYEVSSAVDGIDALAKAETEKYDLLLLDIVMPRKDGIQTLSEIKADKVKYGEPAILMLTNIGGDIAVEESMKLGADGYKLKIDTEPEDLLNIIEETLKKREEKQATSGPSLASNVQPSAGNQPQ